MIVRGAGSSVPPVFAKPASSRYRKKAEPIPKASKQQRNEEQ